MGKLLEKSKGAWQKSNIYLWQINPETKLQRPETPKKVKIRAVRQF